MRCRSPFRRGAVTGLLLCIGVSQSGLAAEWVLTPTTSVDAGYAGNPRFLPEPGKDEFNTAADLGLDLRGGTERLRLAVTPRAHFSRYRSDRDLDTNDQSLRLTGSWQGENSSWTSGAQLLRDSTQTSELGTTGLVQDNQRRASFNVTAGSNWSLSERWSTGFDAGWSKNDYAEAATELTDYSNSTASVHGTFAASERTRLTLTGNGGWLDAASRDELTRNSGVTLGVTRQLDEKWSVSAAAGPSWADSGNATEQSSLLSMNVQRRGEKLTLSLSASQRLDPVGTGDLTRAESVTLTASRTLSERLVLTLSALASRNEQLFDASAGREVRYGTLAASLRWQVRRAWTLVLGFEQRSQEILESTGNDSTADGYRASLGLTWQGQGSSL